MIVLDAFAVIALLRDEPAAPPVVDLLQHDETALTGLGVAEVVDHLVRLIGVDEDEATLDLAQLGLLDPPPLSATDCGRAGLLRARHYHRTSCAVSLADCVAAEVARQEGGALATADPHLLGLCVAEQIDVVVLPDSRGHRWSPG